MRSERTEGFPDKFVGSESVGNVSSEESVGGFFLFCLPPLLS